jgi:type II secretion system protein G
VIVSISELLRAYGLFAAVALVVAAFLVRNWLASPTGRRAWEGLILRVPIIGPLVAQYAMARFCRMLGTLLAADVPLDQRAQRGPPFRRQPDPRRCRFELHRMRQGRQSPRPSLADCRTLFSGSTLEMISVAEESGRLDEELVRIANLTEGDLDRRLKTAVALAEPLMLFFIAGIHRHHFHRHGHPHIHHSGLHQVAITSIHYEPETVHLQPRPRRSAGLHAGRTAPGPHHSGDPGRHRRSQIHRRTEQARITAAQSQIATFSTALDAFEIDNGYYPKGRNGLQELVVQPRDAQNWRGPYLSKGEIPLDPWNHPYIYESPGKRNTSGYDLMSMGPDGREGNDDDITNWQSATRR